MTDQALQVYQEFQGFSTEQEEQLKQMLQQSRIKQRKGGWDKETGKNKMLSYISGDDAIATANRIFGFGRWGYKVTSRTHEVCKDEKKGEIEYYTADVELMVAGSMFPFPGDGMGIVTAPYTVEIHEKARKEAVTDALKRALRHYGDQFGLSLYNEDNYIEAEDGGVKQVKDAGKPASTQQQQPPRRVVDATPAAKPTSVPTPSKLRARCETVCGRGTWEAMLKRLFKAEIAIPDDDLTPDDCGKIAAYLDRAEAMKRAS